MLEANNTNTKESQGPSGFEMDSTHTSDKMKNRNFWEEANRYAWFNPQFWIELLTHPSTKLEKVYKRRRARLYSLLACAFLIVSIVTNVLAFQDSRGTALVVTNFIVNLMLLASYVMSRTKNYLHAKNIGVLACWILPYAAIVIQLNEDLSTNDNDISVSDSFNWLFTPAWMLMAAVFLSRESTIALLILDSISVLVIPGISHASFFQIRKLLFFHMVNNLLLLLSTIIHFRDKLQLNQQQADAEGEGWERDPSTGQGPIARLLLQPHPEVVDRIFRRRSRVLSVVLLAMIPLTIIWSIAESLKWNNEDVDGALISMSVCLCVLLVFLYALSRSKFTRWASRLTLFMFLMVPYVYLLAPHTTQEGQLYAALLATTAAAILGVTLLSGQELITLACVVFFTTIYSPMFPPHIVMSVCLLCAALAHRHDMQEIERTKPSEDVRQQRVVSDGTNLKIPFDKKYCGGALSYSNYVRFQYALTFALCFTLGIVALVAIFRSDVTENPLITVETDDSPLNVNTNYKLYVTTFDCTSTGSQQYDVIGTKGNFHYINDAPLLSNSVTIINLKASGDVGLFTSVSMSLGNGNWVISNHDSCYIYKVEVWDVARNLGVTTQEDFYDASETPEVAPNFKQPQNHALASAQFGALDWFGGGIFRCPRSDFDRQRTIRNRICDFNLVRGPLNWKKIWCPAPRNIDEERGGQLKCYTTQLPDYCNGHGICNRGNCACDAYFTNAKPTYSGRTLINNGFCQIPKAGACDAAASSDASKDPNVPASVAKHMRYRSLDGACNYDIANNADDGLAGMPMGRILPATYSDGDAGTPKQNNGAKLKSEREISNRLFKEPAVLDTSLVFPYSTDMFYGFFRFLYNDMVFITQTTGIQFIWPATSGPADPLRFPITINYLAETKNTGYSFKLKRCRDRVSVARQFDNSVTFWIDGSSIYGVDPEDEMFFREAKVTGTGKKKQITPTDTGRIAMECRSGVRDSKTFTGNWNDCFPPTDDDDNFIIFDSRNLEHPLTFAFHVLFMREHNRLVDFIRRQASCETATEYYIPAYGLPSQKRDTDCTRLYTGNPNYKVPNYGLWSGDDMYRLARMLIGMEIQAIVLLDVVNRFGFNFEQGYTINNRINSGLTLESALLFNLPTLQPDAFHVRAVRVNQSACVAPITSAGNDLDYLDSFPEPGRMELYLQGGAEALINPNNGVRNSNRGNKDIMAILIRRGREMGLPSFTDIREAITTTPSGCKWDTWTPSENCDPATLFKDSALTDLKILYNTPADVELIVGATLSIDTSQVTIDSQSTLDPTQTYLVFGEMMRIINKDIFSWINLPVNPSGNSFLDRFRMDDPKFDINTPWVPSVANTVYTFARSGSQVLIQHNSGVQCIPTTPLEYGGIDTSSFFTQRLNYFTLNPFQAQYTALLEPLPVTARGQYVNCDITLDTQQAFPMTGSRSYNRVFCGNANLQCFQPGLPYCV